MEERTVALLIRLCALYKETRLLKQLEKWYEDEVNTEELWEKVDKFISNLEENEPTIFKFIKKVIGGEELLKGHKRYCFWIENEDLEEALSFNEIARRVEQVKNFRVDGGDVARTLVNRSHQFRYRTIAKESMIVLPCTSSETRQYIPSQNFDNSYISLNSAQVIYIWENIQRYI
jgi:hypothetical protein